MYTNLLLLGILVLNLLMFLTLLFRNKKRLYVTHIHARSNDENLIKDLEGQLYQLNQYVIKDIHIVNATGYDDNRKEIFIIYYK